MQMLSDIEDDVVENIRVSGPLANLQPQQQQQQEGEWELSVGQAGTGSVAKRALTCIGITSSTILAHQERECTSAVSRWGAGLTPGSPQGV
jgi:hypothetical protein